MKSKTSYRITLLFALLLLQCVHHRLYAQKTDERTSLTKRIGNSVKDLYNQGYNSIKRDPKNDSIQNAKNKINSLKSEAELEPYEGKIIREIYIERIGFDQSFTENTSKLANWGTNILNQLHTNTKEFVIRNNLIIKKNQHFSAYIVSDNERYLRSLDFIQDARITVMPIDGVSDSIDLLVITKDIFSLSVSLDADINTAKLKVGDDNLFGMGQTLRTTALYDLNRQPHTAYEFRYGKSNIAGSFINAELGYSEINNGARIGGEQEYASYFRLSKPLVTPYSHFVGAAEISSNTSVNGYHKEDSLFYKYSYTYYNAWLGYNICSQNRSLEKNTKKRERLFWAIRYLNTNFSEKPIQVGNRFDPLYNDKEAVLTSLTFFKENFYKTSYIYGFGTTEDIPIGYNIVATTGWYRQLQLQRLYTGINLSFFKTLTNGFFGNYYLRAGSFYSGTTLQDATLLAGLDVYSPLLKYRSLKIRQFIRVSYSRIFNRITYEPLQIGNSFGLRDYGSNIPSGQERMNINTDLIVYTKLKILGFRLAPFVYADLALLRPDSAAFNKSSGYASIGGGMRMRNDNFVFGTIEMRCIYFPTPMPGAQTFRINISSELQFRYRTDYVRAPDIIRLNESL